MAAVPSEVSATYVGAAAVVTVTGDCDMAFVPQLRQILDARLDTEPPVLVIDLSGATLVDSTCIGAVVAALRRARETGCSIRIVASSYEVRQPFEVTGLGRILTMHDTLEEALAAA